MHQLPDRLPGPPYTAVIFTSVRSGDERGYDVMSARMSALAAEQPGYLAHVSVREGDLGVTVSYWADEDAARAWKQVHEHAIAQERGRSTWYADYRVEVATVHRAYERERAGDQRPR